MPPVRTPAARPQRVGQVFRARVQRRRETENQARRERHQQRESQYRQVDGDLGLVGNRIRRHEREDDVQRAVGERRSDDGTGDGEDDALGEELSHEPPAATAKCRAHGHLALPARGSRQQQVRDVGARDQQQQAHGAKEHPEIVADAARKRLFEGQEAHAPRFREARRRGLNEILDDRFEIRLGLRLVDPGLEPPEHVHVPDAFDGASSFERHRQVNVRAAPHESLRHDADDRPHLVVESKLPSDNAGIAAELPLPELVAQHCHRRRISPAIVRDVVAAVQCRNAHHEKRVRAAVVAAQALRIAFPGPQHVGDGRRDHALEDRAAVGELQVFIGVVVGAVAVPLTSRHLDAHQVVDVLVWKRVEDDGVDDAVHGGRGHDAERQREDGQGREPRCAQERTDAEA